MIKTARQLKDLIRNLSKEKSADAQIIFWNGRKYISDCRADSPVESKGL